MQQLDRVSGSLQQLGLGVERVGLEAEGLRVGAVAGGAGDLVGVHGARAYVIEGRPVTKKNHMQIVRAGKGGRPFLIQAAPLRAWEKRAVNQLFAQYAGPAIAWPVNARIIVYRARAVGDALNYWAAVSDALQKAAVVVNDKWIVSVDGSRLAIDRARPRVEVELTW